MYIFPEFLDSGLEEGQSFPSEDHKIVAGCLALENPLVKDMDTLTAIVQSVIKVPTDKIRTVTPHELVHTYNCPVVW